jgi:hypothetical protein
MDAHESRNQLTIGVNHHVIKILFQTDLIFRARIRLRKKKNCLWIKFIDLSLLLILALNVDPNYNFKMNIKPQT